MDVKDLVELTKAGYTKAEVFQLLGLTQKAGNGDNNTVNTNNDNQQTAHATPTPDAKQTETVAEVKPSVILSENQFQTLLQSLNVSRAGIDVPPEKNIEDNLAERLIFLTQGEKGE